MIELRAKNKRKNTAHNFSVIPAFSLLLKAVLPMYTYIIYSISLYINNMSFPCQAKKYRLQHTGYLLWGLQSSSCFILVRI